MWCGALRVIAGCGCRGRGRGGIRRRELEDEVARMVAEEKGETEQRASALLEEEVRKQGG
jgi:hypothetical protein